MPSRLPSPSTLVSVGLAAAGALAAAPARADDAPRRVWIDARPRTCLHAATSLAREVELACDALGACEVAESPESATHRAILVCESSARWTLRAEDAAGRPIYAVALEGDREERLRKAAMWIARAGDDGPVGDPLAPAPATPEAAPRTAAATDDAEHDAEHDAANPVRARGRGGVALDALVGVTNSERFDSFHGLHAAVMYPVGRWQLGGAASVSQMFATGSGFGGAVLAADVETAGARAGWGAPWDDSVAGAWIEAGVAWGHAKSPEAPWSRTLTRARGFVGPYGRAELVIQLPFHAPVRPYVYAAGTQTFGELGESVQSAMAGAGLAWRAW